MAVHPLRPATDPRLGRPLPHQLPNQPRATPIAISLSSLELMLYYLQFPGAIHHYRTCSHVLLTRPPLSIRASSHTPSDLHVLSVPPAFVLSQDQTLKLNLLSPKGLLPHTYLTQVKYICDYQFYAAYISSRFCSLLRSMIVSQFIYFTLSPVNQLFTFFSFFLPHYLSSVSETLSFQISTALSLSLIP